MKTALISLNLIILSGISIFILNPEISELPFLFGILIPVFSFGFVFQKDPDKKLKDEVVRLKKLDSENGKLNYSKKLLEIQQMTIKDLTEQRGLNFKILSLQGNFAQLQKKV